MDILFFYTRDLKGGINMCSTSEKIRYALFDYVLPISFMFLAIFCRDYYLVSFNYLGFAFLTAGFLTSKGAFAIFIPMIVCAVVWIAGYYTGFDYQYYMTVAGLASFPIGSILINIYAARA